MACAEIPKFCQHARAKLELEFDWATRLANFWRAGEVYSVGERVRSASAPGFEFECTAAGQSGSREPKFRLVQAADQAVSGDGAVSWISRPISDSSLSRTISSSTWEAPAAVAFEGQATTAGAGEQKTRATVSLAAGQAAGTYRVTNVVTLTGGKVDVQEADVEFEA